MKRFAVKINASHESQLLCKAAEFVQKISDGFMLKNVENFANIEQELMTFCRQSLKKLKYN